MHPGMREQDVTTSFFVKGSQYVSMGVVLAFAHSVATSSTGVQVTFSTMWEGTWMTCGDEGSTFFLPVLLWYAHEAIDPKGKACQKMIQ